MMFIIKGLKYDTEKMKHIADVKKWYSYNSSLLNGFWEKKPGKLILANCGNHGTSH